MAAIDEVISKNNRKGFVTDDRLGTQNCMPESQRLGLADTDAGDIFRHAFPDNPE